MEEVKKIKGPLSRNVSDMAFAHGYSGATHDHLEQMSASSAQKILEPFQEIAIDPEAYFASTISILQYRRYC